MKTRILLADDHAILRAGLRLLINGQPDLEVVAEADNGVKVLSLVEETRPDLVLLDLTMPGLGGLDVLRALKQVSPESRVLILTMHDDESYLRQALSLGASGYVLKKAVDSELLNALRAVADRREGVGATVRRKGGDAEHLILGTHVVVRDSVRPPKKRRR